MATKYNVIHSSGEKEIGVSQDRAISVKTSDAGAKIIEVVTDVKVKRKKQAESEFINTLSVEQKRLLTAKEREVCYSDEFGYFLKVIEVEKPFFSPVTNENARKERIQKGIKSALKDPEILNHLFHQTKFESRIETLDFDEFLAEIVKIAFIKK